MAVRLVNAAAPASETVFFNNSDVHKLVQRGPRTGGTDLSFPSLTKQQEMYGGEYT